MKKKGSNYSLRILAIFLAIFAITLYLPNNIITISASQSESDDSEYVESETEIEYAEESESESEMEIIGGMVEIPPQGGETADIQGNDQFSHYIPNDEGGGAYSIEDGVYAFENVGNAGFWMDVENYSSGSDVWQYSSSTIPTSSFDRSCLFKITRRPGTDSYIIRSMLNNRLTIYFSGNQVLTKEISPNDDDVANSDTFEIVYSGGGQFTIRPYGLSQVISAPNTTSSGSSGAPNSYLIKSTASTAGNRAKWKMYKYTGATQSSVFVTKSISTTNGIERGTTITYGLKTWSTEIGKNTPFLYVPEKYFNMAFSIWNSTNYTLTITAREAGDFKISAQILDDETNAAYKNYTFSYVLTPHLDDIESFVVNCATGKYIDIEGPSKNEGAFIQQWQFNNKTQSKWLFEAQSDGYFTIKSQYSSKYIGVDPTNTEYIRQYGTVGDNTLWKFVKTSSGNYKIICKSLAASGYVLATQSQTSGNGSNLMMTPYTDDTNYRDEWNLQRSITFNDIIMDVGDVRSPDISILVSTISATTSDFTFSVVASSVPNVFSINSTTKKITANNRGSALIKATSSTYGDYFFDAYVLCCSASAHDKNIHNYTLDQSGYYLCNNCRLSTESPALQDYSVLTKGDLLKIQSLSIVSGICAKLQDEEMLGVYGEYLYTLPLKMIDDIRSNNQYIGGFSYSDSTGRCYPVSNYLYNQPMYGGNSVINDVFVQKKCDYYADISGIQAAGFNGTISSAVYTAIGVVGLFVPESTSNVANRLLPAILSSNAVDGPTDYIDEFLGEAITYIPHLESTIGLSITYGLISLCAEISGENFCSEGDDVVKITLIDNVGHEYIFMFAYDQQGNLINQSIDIGYTHN